MLTIPQHDDEKVGDGIVWSSFYVPSNKED